MPRRCLFCAAAVLLMLMISQRSNSQQQGQPPDDSRAAASKNFAVLSDQFMKDSLAWSPVSASAAGYHSHMDPKSGRPLALDALLDDFSPQSFATQRDFYAGWRERFHKELPSALDPEAAAVIKPHLLAREELLWCGRPHDTAALRWRAGVIIAVGIAALAMRSLPLDSSLADRADANSILLAVIVGVLIAEAIVSADAI